MPTNKLIALANGDVNAATMEDDFMREDGSVEASGWGEKTHDAQVKGEYVRSNGLDVKAKGEAWRRLDA